MITVEKIGGTSMSRFEDVLRNIMLRDPPQRLERRGSVTAARRSPPRQRRGPPGIDRALWDPGRV